MANSYTTEQRAFIVSGLANCDSPELIVAKFKTKFKGVPCDIADIGACAPHRLTGKWREYFDDERGVFLEAPAGKKEVRMAILSRLAIAAAGNNQPAEALKALELLAKEDAGFFAPKATAKVEDGKNDGPMSFTFNLDKANGKPD